jgi:8-oxo-dGTP diphosphatase
MDSDPQTVRAAGGVVWRNGPDGVCIAAVHRPRYDDWSLPKGKLDAGETWEACALREVDEETGLRCRLGEELPSTAYRDNKGRSKVVRYWLMEALDGDFSPNSEVDELRWMAPGQAAELMSYDRDAEIVRAAQQVLAGRLEAS